jgi:hypothetical protein
MKALTEAGIASQSASEIPAGALLISSHLLLRSKQESGRCKAVSSTDRWLAHPAPEQILLDTVLPTHIYD